MTEKYNAKQKIADLLLQLAGMARNQNRLQPSFYYGRREAHFCGAA